MNSQTNTAEGYRSCGPAYGRSHWGNRYGYQPPYTSNRKAPVSIYKTDKTYEIMLFAPGRDKENFKVQIKGNELVISYKPTIDTSNLNWVRKEYSRGGFERIFMLDDSMDPSTIEAKYENGVLNISLNIKATNESDKQDVQIK
jgi:HSP20 family protein